MPFPPARMAARMRRALFLAEGNLGATSPNPSVGAVIADAATGEIVASAVTAPGGRPHAEVQALGQAGERARGSVLFTTLEPCSHFGATPPCAHAVAEAGVATVVYGSFDPDMRVAGRGLAWLESHGVQVLRGDFAKEADWLNLGHSLRVTERRPFVQIKLAVDANGRVPAGGGGRPVWVTGEAARAHAHLLRARADAILVGRKTVETDDPELTCRLPGLEDRSPVRVVLAPRCGIPAQARLFSSPQPPMGSKISGWCDERGNLPSPQPSPHGRGSSLAAVERASPLPWGEGQGEGSDPRYVSTHEQPRVWIVCGDSSKCGGLIGMPGVKVFDVGASTSGSLNLRLVLMRLAAEGITRLLVEGGPTTASTFLDAGLADEVVIMQSEVLLDPSSSLPAFAGQGLELVTFSYSYILAARSKVGPDTIYTYRSTAHWQA
ncbi:MAG: bifunctional diaminohydroxyphosphoribosylaminopyrimidine deaminase/5-amino-6-(5-phosphoribosylamino)uracil reductase RibD [Rhodomicrobium sp.]